MLLNEILSNWGIVVHEVDMTDLESLAQQCAARSPKLIWIEPVTNPFIKVCTCT